MEQQQQNTNPNVQPSLADLDTPPVVEEKKPEQTGIGDNPTTTPSKVVDESKQEPQIPEEKVEADQPEKVIEETEVTPDDFWGAVSKLRGDEFKFEFPQDIEDSMTPEGVHHAIRASESRAIEQFEETLSKRDPRGYAYLLHRANGGDDDTFFANKTEVLPELETLKGSVDLQQAFYKRDLIRKGIEPEHADLIIKDAVDKNKLFGLVEVAHKTTQKAQEDQLIQLQKLNDQNEQRYQQAVNKMAATLQERILQNKGLDITIPDARRTEFLQFVNSVLDIDPQTGKWYISQEFTSENMPQVLGALYYNMVKGNMDDIISNKVNQKVAKKFQLKMQSDKTKKNSAPDPNKKTNEKEGVQPALSEL